MNYYPAVLNGGVTFLGPSEPGTVGQLLGLVSSTQLGFVSVDLSAYAKTSSLATVATSGKYADLLSTPTLGTSSAKDIPAKGNASVTQVVYGTDTRLSDARTPTTHASNHATGGTDVITPESIGAAALGQDATFQSVDVSGDAVITGVLIVEGLISGDGSQLTGITVSQVSKAASTSSGLSQFPTASTTSDQLAAVLTGTTGTDGFVRATGATLAGAVTVTTPTSTTTAFTLKPHASQTTTPVLRVRDAGDSTDVFQLSATGYPIVLDSAGATQFRVYKSGPFSYLSGRYLRLAAESGTDLYADLPFYGLSGGGHVVALTSAGVVLGSAQGIRFTIAASIDTVDASIARVSPALLRSTNGSTGAGGFRAILYGEPYTFSTVPSASANTGATIRITDRSHRLATSDGTNWNWAGTTTPIS
jgi:hypothetical protein